MWMLGNVAFVLPVIPPDASPELEYALRLRRETSLTGKCDQCGAAVGWKPGVALDGTTIAEAYIPHRRNCPAHDMNTEPLLRSYYEEQDNKPFGKALSDASARTKEKLEKRLLDPVLIKGNETEESWAEGLLDGLLEKRDQCEHLKTRPAQTWNILLGTTKFQCDECWAYFQASIANGTFRMSTVEEHTCDRCRRYVASLSPLVVRISNFVLHGGLCVKCAREMAPDFPD